jgi:hypothetical protein
MLFGASAAVSYSCNFDVHSDTYIDRNSVKIDFCYRIFAEWLTRIFNLSCATMALEWSRLLSFTKFLSRYHFLSTILSTPDFDRRVLPVMMHLGLSSLA